MIFQQRRLLDGFDQQLERLQNLVQFGIHLCIQSIQLIGAVENDAQGILSFFKNQRFYWPHIIDPDFPSADGIYLQLRSAIGHLNEAWAAEAAIRAVGLFGGGIGHTGNTCGALLGAFAALSMVYSRGNLEEKKAFAKVLCGIK